MKTGAVRTRRNRLMNRYLAMRAEIDLMRRGLDAGNAYTRRVLEELDDLRTAKDRALFNALQCASILRQEA